MSSKNKIELTEMIKSTEYPAVQFQYTPAALRALHRELTRNVIYCEAKIAKKKNEGEGTNRGVVWVGCTLAGPGLSSSSLPAWAVAAVAARAIPEAGVGAGQQHLHCGFPQPNLWSAWVAWAVVARAIPEAGVGMGQQYLHSHKLFSAKLFGGAGPEGLSDERDGGCNGWSGWELTGGNGEGNGDG
ncbi:hypothetical protein DFH08DRAFT_824896 [Mycena albidolilacea]|uniref:Uncharacterized protein n=1 Tax=Mycena albidolilacea TaxID=1033008 RepID=A0AAD6Z3H5_9AGAR|nr:hypothetical protein DFH08DRAFT_824896 [Mycena albidolilacea]